MKNPLALLRRGDAHKFEWLSGRGGRAGQAGTGRTWRVYKNRGEGRLSGPSSMGQSLARSRWLENLATSKRRGDESISPFKVVSLPFRTLASLPIAHQAKMTSYVLLHHPTLNQEQKTLVQLVINFLNAPKKASVLSAIEINSSAPLRQPLLSLPSFLRGFMTHPPHDALYCP